MLQIFSVRQSPACSRHHAPVSMIPEVQASDALGVGALSLGFLLLVRMLPLRATDQWIELRGVESRLKGEIGGPSQDEEEDPGSLKSRIRSAKFSSAPVFQMPAAQHDGAAPGGDGDRIDGLLRSWEYRVAGMERAHALLESQYALARKNQETELAASLESQMVRLGPRTLEARAAQLEAALANAVACGDQTMVAALRLEARRVASKLKERDAPGDERSEEDDDLCWL